MVINQNNNLVVAAERNGVAQVRSVAAGRVAWKEKAMPIRAACGGVRTERAQQKNGRGVRARENQPRSSMATKKNAAAGEERQASAR